MDYGSECELTTFQNNFLTWPTQYGDNQYMVRMKAFWIGCKNFYDPVEKKVKGVKVVGSGPRYDAANQTSMGVSVTKKILAFTQQNHENYFIYDIVLTNTGIINSNGEVYSQTLEDFWVYFNYRYAFAGV